LAVHRAPGDYPAAHAGVDLSFNVHTMYA
jgi:hypothetical protein